MNQYTAAEWCEKYGHEGTKTNIPATMGYVKIDGYSSSGGFGWTVLRRYHIYRCRAEYKCWRCGLVEEGPGGEVRIDINDMPREVLPPDHPTILSELSRSWIQTWKGKLPSY